MRLGAILYELCSGRKPHPGESHNAIPSPHRDAARGAAGVRAESCRPVSGARRLRAGRRSRRPGRRRRERGGVAGAVRQARGLGGPHARRLGRRARRAHASVAGRRRARSRGARSRRAGHALCAAEPSAFVGASAVAVVAALWGGRRPAETDCGVERSGPSGREAFARAGRATSGAGAPSAHFERGRLERHGAGSPPGGRGGIRGGSSWAAARQPAGARPHHVRVDDVVRRRGAGTEAQALVVRAGHVRSAKPVRVAAAPAI